LLVHRAGAGAPEAAAILREALPGPLRGASIFATLVVKGGESGNVARASVRELSGIAFTNDPHDAWCKRFRLERDGATVLLGSDGTEIWRDDGPLRLERLLEVSKKLDPAGARPPRRLPVSLALGLGIVAPDFFFQCKPEVATSDFAMSTTTARTGPEAADGKGGTDEMISSRRRADLRQRRRGSCAALRILEAARPRVFGPPRRTPARTPAARRSCWAAVRPSDAERPGRAARFGLEHAHEHRQETCGSASEPKPTTG
jgi:hypothetical protein